VLALARSHKKDAHGSGPSTISFVISVFLKGKGILVLCARIFCFKNKPSTVMKKVIVNVILLVSTVLMAATCKEATERSNEMVKKLDGARAEVYQEVKNVKNSTLGQTEKEKLKAEYEAVAKKFNDEYDAIVKRLLEDPLFKGKCVVLNYGSVVEPSAQNLKDATKMADDFRANAQKALSPNPDASAGIMNALPIVIDLLNAFVDKKIEVCKEKIEKMKYNSWEKI
jgi:hypothetical protein